MHCLPTTGARLLSAVAEEALMTIDLALYVQLFFARNLAQSLSLCYLDYIVYRPVRCVLRFIQVLD